MEELQKKYDENIMKLKNIVAKYNTLVKTYNQIVNDYQNVANKYNSLNNEFNDLKKENEQLKSTIKNINEMNLNQKNTIDTLKQNLIKLQSERQKDSDKEIKEIENYINVNDIINFDTLGY